jgi:hypothetical protein
MSKEGSLFFSELFWLEKNQKLEDEMFESEDELLYKKKELEYNERVGRGPVPVYYSNGSFKEVVVEGYSKEFSMYGVPTYDELRSKAKTSFEVDLWDECEEIERQENCDVEHYSLIRPEIFDMMMKESEGKLDEIPDYNFGLMDDDDIFDEFLESSQFDFGKTFDEKEEEEVPNGSPFVEKNKMEVRTAYDGLMLYMYLHSLGEIPRQISKLDEMLRIVSEYYDRKNVEFTIKDKIPIQENVKKTIQKYFDTYFAGGGRDLIQINLVPHALFFLTTSIEKYKDVFHLFENQRFAVFRVPVKVDEIQGDFLQVSLHKLMQVESQFNACMIEDTALGLDRFDYIGAAYIKDFFSMGGVRFYQEFDKCKTLWISTCVSKDRFKNYYISVFGTCGQIGPPVEINAWSFNSVNYVDGKCVGSDLDNWPKYHPRRKAMSRLLKMMSTRHGGNGSIKCKFKHPIYDDIVYDAYLCHGFHGFDTKARKVFDSIIGKLKW